MIKKLILLFLIFTVQNSNAVSLVSKRSITTIIGYSLTIYGGNELINDFFNIDCANKWNQRFERYRSASNENIVTFGYLIAPFYFARNMLCAITGFLLLNNISK